MNSNKAAYTPLHRNRRRSNPASPTSPVFPRRLTERPGRANDVVSPIDGFSALSLNSDNPVSNVDLPSSSSTLPHAIQPSIEGKPLFRASEENGRPLPRFSVDMVRPATSDAIENINGPPHGYGAATSPDPSSKSSLVPNSNRYGESSERHSYERQGKQPEGQSPNLRNLSFSSQAVERGFQDEQGPSKLGHTKKSGLSRLNPMSLLARRRSSQNTNENPNLTINTWSVPALPDNFEPSIRGTITHDFSAPRTRRTPSYGEAASFEQPLRPEIQQPPRDTYRPDKPSPRLQPSAGLAQSHSPVFTEHFQDDRQTLRPEQTRYLQNITTASNSADTAQLAASMPAFAKKLPVKLPEAGGDSLSHRRPTHLDLDRPLPKEPIQPPPAPPKSTPSPTLDVTPPSALPKHMKSTSSRFSFQLSGTASSAQEKLLEEKHKEHQATKGLSPTGRDDELEEENYDDYDFDADDGLEERIPGVNADYEDDVRGDGLGTAAVTSQIDTVTNEPTLGARVNPLHRQSLQGFHFTPQTMTFSPTSTNHASQPTPRDNDGFAIGIADSRDSPHQGVENLEQYPDSDAHDSNISFLEGLGIVTSKAPPQVLHQTSQRRGGGFDESDIYFDDGEFDNDLRHPEEQAFDEAIFDDETGKIRDIPAENARKLENALQAAGRDGEVKVVDRSAAASQAPVSGHGDADPAFRQNISQMLGQMPGSSAKRSNGTITGLTEGNLAAYHDALAMAANEAAANGKFNRNAGFNQDSEDDTSQSQLESSQPGLISDESRFSNNFDNPGIAEDDGFPFDDDMDDELMIAEANAEALENDDDGFYGQEFGFYARAPGKTGTEMVNGGFFASRGSNGVKRSCSGRANFQEPSLTPITERSEWSTRNSVASLQILGGIPGSAHSLPSPGIAQLLELDSPGFEEDMSLSALLKLRRGAFGGSSTSINSINAVPPGSSPLAHHSSHSFSPQDHAHGHHRMPSSAHSLTASAGIPESEEEDDGGAEKQTVTQNTPRKTRADPSPTSPQDYLASPSLGVGERRKGGHSRNSSGAESVSYARDVDGRWVLERKRTGEDGGLEVIDREYVAGAHI